jgi:hypothetical protein
MKNSQDNQKSDAIPMGSDALLGVADLNGYTKHFYGYRRVINEHTHWITFFTETIQMFGYRTDDENMDKVYDTGMVKVDNKQLQQLIDVWCSITPN